jgi:DNA (cytosine-5)-methyltransferase 1
LNKTKVRVVDLFAGAGGFSLGAQNAGAEVVFAVEFDKFAAHTYTRNICRNGTTKIYIDDIASLDATELKKAHFATGSGCDLLLGGPPCQGFSTHRINDAGVNDPRNNLIYRYFDFVRALQPRAFLMENVPGLLWPRHAQYLRKFYELASEAGYHLFAPETLDARNYGVPQRRKRVFVLGFRDKEDLAQTKWPPKASHAEDCIDPSLSKWLTCETAFLATNPADPNDIHMNHGVELTSAFANTPVNGGSRRESGRILACHKVHDGHKDVYGRVNPKAPAPTMTTACINPSKGRFVHPTENHGITVRQAARIQTFPDDYIFEGGLTAAGRQIGNAVPVKLAEVLINCLVESLQTSTKVSICSKELEAV